MNPDVFVCGTPGNVANVRDAAPGTPIVFAAVTDPVADGFVEAIAEPGGLITGVTHMPYSMSGNWLELLLEIVPQTVEVGFLINSLAVSSTLQRWEALLGPAADVGVTPTLYDVRAVEEIGSAIDDLASRPNVGLIVPPNNWLHGHRDAIVAAVDRHRLPTIYSGEPYADAGGLVTLAQDLVEAFMWAGQYAGRILNGAAPADLPVRSSRFLLIINLRTANAHGITIPPSLLARATRVIE
jgi:putative ABC transport system substrate-binding protein